MAKVEHSPAPRWRSAKQSDLIWSVWEDQCIAFHRPSGKTHCLNAAGRDMLTRILLKPMTATEAATRFGEDPVVEDDDTAREITTMLEYLEELGLVERL